MKDKIEVFTPIRGIAAILVAVSHMNFIWERHAELAFMGNGNFSVVIFFMLSGFVLMYRYGDRITKRLSFDEYKKYIKRRIGKIYILYISTQIIFFIFVVGGEVIHKGEGIDVLMKYIVQFLYTATMLQSLVPFESVCWVLNTTLWYVSVLFIFYLLTPMLLRSINKVLRNNTIFRSFIAIMIVLILYGLSLTGLGVLGGKIGQIFPNERVVLDLTTPYINIFYFILGMLICKFVLICKEKEIDRRIPTSIFGIAEIILGVGLLFLNFSFADRRVSTIGIVIWLIIIAFQKGVLCSLLCRSKILNFLGKISLHIYMVHFIYTVIYVYVYKMIIPDTEFGYIALIISLWVLIIPSAYMVYRIQNSYTLRKQL